ncbi:MAG: hypothetical protein V3V98_07415 [Thermoplasmata archaeon]
MDVLRKKDGSGTFERVELRARVSMEDDGVVVVDKEVAFDNYTFKAMRVARSLKKGDLFFADVGVQPMKCSCGKWVRGGFFEIKRLEKVSDWEADLEAAKKLRME